MTSPSHPEGQTGDTGPADADIPDYTVSIDSHPALVRPDVDVPMTVEVSRLSAAWVADRVVDVETGRPAAPLADAIETEVEHAGYELDEFERIDVPIVDDPNALVDVEVELRVRALEGETETETEAGED